MGSLNGSLGGSSDLSASLGGLHRARNLQTVSSLPTLSTPNTPSSLKKPLLPNCVLSKSLNSNVTPAGYKLARSSPVKQQQPLLPGRAKEKLQPLAPERRALVALASDTESAERAETSDFHSDSEGSFQDKKGACRQSQSGKYAETSEDMSLSSASSLDRGDTSEEFLDDFDSPGDVLSDVDTAENSDSSRKHTKKLQTDWLQPDMTELKDISPMDVSCGSLVLCPESNHTPAESSLELSPSNSSGGTYMWDEEGLEPIEGPASHPLDSYEDADLNSLNERLSALRRRQGAQDLLAPFYSEGKQHIQAFDELTIEHMSQDCHILKNHLLRLQDLLKLEDADSPVQAAEMEAEDKSTTLQELIKEVQGLREELRSRDRTIAQLRLQCQQLQQQPQQMPAQGHQVRCQCHHQRAPHSQRTSDQRLDKQKQQHYDKATQTHHRPPANTGVLPTPMLSPWQAQNQGLARPSMQQRRHSESLTPSAVQYVCKGIRRYSRTSV
ncbi:hypothetical protein WMY93_018648 [Mugilogobius chulae]|uniref:Coiled-coil serine-rich protein 2 n=1 Tax=Mugilogobius chulae TaxID=88201 RepID=A0AAW0NNS2_9GOBI